MIDVYDIQTILDTMNALDKSAPHDESEIAMLIPIFKSVVEDSGLKSDQKTLGISLLLLDELSGTKYSGGISSKKIKDIEISYTGAAGDRNKWWGLWKNLLYGDIGDNTTLLYRGIGEIKKRG